MTKDKRNVILFFTGLFVLIGAMVVFNLYNKDHVDVNESDAIEVDPTSLYNLYVTDSLNAHKKFDDQVIKVRGEVSSISENMQKQQVILIKTSASGGNINCTMAEPAQGLIPGSIITIKGVCNGLGEGDADLGIPGDVYVTRTLKAN